MDSDVFGKKGGKNMFGLSKRKRIICLLILASLFFSLFSCSAPQVRRKPKVVMSNINRVAVIDFENYTTDKGLGIEIVGEIMSKIVEAGQIQLVERGQLEGVLREQNLAVKGFISPETAKEVGKILGVDALILGEITYYQTTAEMNVDQNPPFTPKHPENPSSWDRLKMSSQDTTNIWEEDKVTTNISLRLVEVETGSVVWSRSMSVEVRKWLGSLVYSGKYNPYIRIPSPIYLDVPEFRSLAIDRIVCEFVLDLFGGYDCDIDFTHLK